MYKKSAVIDSENRITNVSLSMKAEDIFSEKFKDFLEDIFICIIAENLNCLTNDPDDKFLAKVVKDYIEKTSSIVLNAALGYAVKMGKDMTCPGNRYKLFERALSLVQGKGFEK